MLGKQIKEIWKCVVYKLQQINRSRNINIETDIKIFFYCYINSQEKVKYLPSLFVLKCQF